MKLRITSDGTPQGTKVVDVATGDRLAAFKINLVLGVDGADCDIEYPTGASYQSEKAPLVLESLILEGELALERPRPSVQRKRPE